MIKRFILLLPALAILSSIWGQMSPASLNPPKNWQNESIEKDSVYGTGSDLALELLKGKTATPVVVAVIDGGVYIRHPALKDQVWVNPKEIPNNHVDDDHNGYVDDINGWDFIGGKDSDIKQENLEVTRLYRELSKKYANSADGKVSGGSKAEYKKYLGVKKVFETKHTEYQKQYDNLKGFVDTIAIMKTSIGKNDFTKDDLDNYNPSDSGMIRAKARMMRNFKRFSMIMKGATADSIIVLVSKGLKFYNAFLEYQYNVDFSPRFVVGDNPEDASQRNYGNNDVIGPTDEHGTHVSGIIAGKRTGIPGAQEGIADHVKIMAVRVVPDGDERDKDVANGIRYAVDNGAKVINMSFGKAFSYNKKAVDAAVKYAAAHDVLLVHAAGNDHQDNDITDNFPNRKYLSSFRKAKNWIEVGASDIKGRPGGFSNFGKVSVDLFAPGVKIYSTIPDSGFAYLSGTSMAAPCVTGVAAIIREYFPSFSAKKVKRIIMRSVTKIDFSAPKPGTYKVGVEYGELCRTGGTINAYKAVQLAMKKAGFTK